MVGGADTTKYTYDAFGNLLNVRFADGTTVEYLIDGQNRRVGKKENGVLTKRWLYSDDIRIVAELDSTNQIVSRFVYTASMNVPEYMVRGGVIYRLIKDHLGSVRYVVDTQTGVVVQQLDYDEFGTVLLNTNPNFVPFGFAGGLYEPTTKLVRFRARDYDGSIGRWITKDPLLFASRSTNHYSYCKNDPIDLIDSRGTNSVASGIHSALMMGVSITEMIGTINDMTQAASSNNYGVLGTALAEHSLAAASFGVSAAEFTANIFGKTTGLGNDLLEMTLQKIGTGKIISA